MTYELYTIAGAPRPWRALLGLVAKGLPFAPRILECTAFLCGDAISAADCVAFPEVRLTLRTTARFPDVTARLGLHPLTDSFPRLSRWIHRIESLPGYDQTFPAHWK